MYHLKIKDVKFRKKFHKLEIKLNLKRFVYRNMLSHFYFQKNFNIYNLISFQNLKRKRKRISTKFVNRCILSNRSKSIRTLKISRLHARELISFGIIPGFKKAIW